MPRRVFQHPAIRGDIADALGYTEERWGERKKAEYKDLIKEAIDALRDNPRLARRRPDIHPEARIHRIGQPGRDGTDDLRVMSRHPAGSRLHPTFRGAGVITTNEGHDYSKGINGLVYVPYPRRLGSVRLLRVCIQWNSLESS